MTSPFDRALASQELAAAADAYAARYGDPGTPAHRAAWLRFRAQVRTTEDLRLLWQAERATAKRVARILQAAMERAIQIDGATMGTAQLVDPKLSGLRLVAQHGFESAFVNFFKVVDDTTTSCGAALSSGQPVWVPEVVRSEIFAHTPGLEVILEAGSRAVASLPIISPDGQLLAMISTHHSRPMRWTQEAQRSLERLCRSGGRLLKEAAETDGR